MSSRRLAPPTDGQELAPKTVPDRRRIATGGHTVCATVTPKSCVSAYPPPGARTSGTRQIRGCRVTVGGHQGPVDLILTA
jgi:hypothetical protein